MSTTCQDDRQEFVIVGLHQTVVTGFGKPMEACAQFMYKGYEVSMSTSGRSQHCRTRVAIFNVAGEYVEETDTVQEAIEHIDGIFESIKNCG